MFLLFYETCINYTIIQFLIWNVNFSNIYIDISKKIKLEKILSDIIFIQNDESFNIRINICKILNNHATLFQSSSIDTYELPGRGHSILHFRFSRSFERAIFCSPWIIQQ